MGTNRAAHLAIASATQKTGIIVVREKGVGEACG